MMLKMMLRRDGVFFLSLVTSFIELYDLTSIERRVLRQNCSVLLPLLRLRSDKQEGSSKLGLKSWNSCSNEDMKDFGCCKFYRAVSLQLCRLCRWCKIFCINRVPVAIFLRELDVVSKWCTFDRLYVNIEMQNTLIYSKITLNQLECTLSWILIILFF